MDELKRCPFCGAPAARGFYSGAPIIHCRRCPASMGGEESTATEAELIAAWNTRAAGVSQGGGAEGPAPFTVADWCSLCGKRDHEEAACPTLAAGVAAALAPDLITAADQHADSYDGQDIPARDVRAAIYNAFFAGARFGAAGVAATPLCECARLGGLNPACRVHGAGVAATPRVTAESWKRLAESQQALLQTDQRIREIGECYGLDAGVAAAPAGCHIDQFASRTCERGTKGCSVGHGVAAAPAAQLVAWVEVKDSYEGPYEFHGMELLPVGKHHLYLAPRGVAQAPAPHGVKGADHG